MPKVSVVLTSYNHADFISESIESILNQTFSDFELLVVDDCSTDNSWDVIRDYAQKDSRIIPIRHTKNIGGAIRPELINKLKGEYFCIAHCDDRWELTKLAKQVKYMDAHPDTGACFTWVSYINEKGDIIKNLNQKYVDFNIKNHNRFYWLHHFFFNGNCLCHPSVMLRTEIQKDEKLYSVGLGSLPDLNRWVKLCLKHEIYIIPEQLTCFRIRDNAMNTSGYTAANTIRCQFDTLQIASHYLSLDNSDFLKVFPEAKKYVINKEFVKDFALARISIDLAKTYPSYVLFGLQLIYNLLQIPSRRTKLEKLYNYTSRDFSTEVGEHDIFRIVDSKDIIHPTLFFDTGHDYNEKEKITQTVMLRDSHFKLVYRNLPQDIQHLRFDPDENTFRKFKDLHIIINGQDVEYQTNGYQEDGDEWLYFLTTDPQIFPSLPEKVKSIIVSGTTEPVTYELDQIITKKLDNNPSFFQRLFKK